MLFINVLLYHSLHEVGEAGVDHGLVLNHHQEGSHQVTHTLQHNYALQAGWWCNILSN